jgi:hypothetical protein
MGLLDEAIREHLELKRLRGADPVEVAREQREALPAGTAERSSEPRGTTPVAAGELFGEVAGTLSHTEAGQLAGPPRDLAGQAGEAIQETAELDMRALLEEELDVSVGSASETGRFSVRDRRTDRDQDYEESSLEWELPGDVPEGSVPHEVQSEPSSDAGE